MENENTESEETSDTGEMPPTEMEFLFDDLLGSHEELGGLFNTFRIGLRWLDLLATSPGEGLPVVDVVAVDRATGRRLTLDYEAVVLSVHHGTLGDMLELHAGLHHRCKSPMPADRRAEICGMLHCKYGRPIAPSEKCVVVYLARMGD